MKFKITEVTAQQIIDRSGPQTPQRKSGYQRRRRNLLAERGVTAKPITVSVEKIHFK